MKVVLDQNEIAAIRSSIHWHLVILTFKSHFIPSKASLDEKAQELLIIYF